MRSQLVRNRLRSNSTSLLTSVAPSASSKEYSTTLANTAARILYRSPLPSKDDLPVFILNAAGFPDARTTDYDALLPYVLARLPGDEELIGGHGYEVVFFAGGGGGNEAMQNKKGRPGWGWFLQAYHVLTRATRKRLQKLYLVHEKNWIRVLVEMFATVVSPKFRKKIVHVSTMSGLALHIPIENLLIPPSAYLTDRTKSPDIHAPYASGRRAFAVHQCLPLSTDGSVRLPRVLREATSFVLMDENIKQEGIFRVSARAQSVEILRESYDRGQKFIVWKEVNAVMASSAWKEGTGEVWVEDVHQTEGYELHAAAAMIKLWYKELKEPIFPPTCYQALEKFYSNPESPFEVSQLLAMLSMDDEWTPISNQTSRQILTMHLLPLLSRVADFEDSNHMSPDNLAVCFAPSLLHGPDPLEDLKLSTLVRRILVAMIKHWNELEPLLDLSFERFEHSLRTPEAIEDREDSLEESTSETWSAVEAQVSGITLMDNDDSDDSIEDIPPPLPPRPRAATSSHPPRPQMATSGHSPPHPTSPVETGSPDDISPIDAGPFSRTDSADLTSPDGISPIRRKPAPALQALPRYSTIINDRAAALQRLQYYNTTAPGEDASVDTDDMNGLPMYQEGVPTYEEPNRPPPSPPATGEPSMKRKPLPKTTTG